MDKSRFRTLAFAFQFAGCGLLLAGCSLLPEAQVDAVRHFTLSGPAEAGAATDALVVRPVRLAGHLRNRSMAVRVSANEVVYLDEVRWAEPLDEAITQVLRNRLRQIPGGAAVVVQIQRCELVQSEGNAVQLAATYTITPSGGGDAKTGVFTATPRTWGGGDHGAVVDLVREAVEELAGAIAASVEK
ncbi:MAG TPA: ABC-type transport auxiliary lipoprotein family protein [Lacunisphaera sp.]|nr:ABC-type transport auxiliary lipoprotein family protein [Lacunisphaera sp.]